MRVSKLGAPLLALAVLAGCETDDGFFDPGPGQAPAPPLFVDAFYYALTVNVTWELSPDWNGEAFRIYSRRTTDPDFVLIAEVTSCDDGFCTYADINIVGGVSYEYIVSAVDPVDGTETDGADTPRVDVPLPVPPDVPDRPEVVALDDANFIRWDGNARSANDFSHYRVYLEDPDGAFLLGETDSEGFLDLLALNGETYAYFVTSIDDQGHESEGSVLASGTPRPDYHGEVIYDFFDRPDLSGFRFQETEDTDPLVPGDDPGRHFRLETDAEGWWLVPGPGTLVHRDGFATTALKCGVGADADCVALEVAPSGGYVDQDLFLLPQTTYVLEVFGDDGLPRFGAIRVELLGFDQDDNALMIFDWAFQLQTGNPQLAPRAVPTR